MTQILGLTGGMGTGKTTVSNIFKDNKIPVINADDLTHDLENSNKELITEIKTSFGSGVIINNKIDRHLLGKTVFNDKSKLRRLIRIVDPYLRREIAQKIKSSIDRHEALIVLELPQLFEQGYEMFTDKVMVVICDTNIQIDRILKRDNLSLQEVSNRLKMQWPLIIKQKLSDIVIDNSTNISQLKSQVIKWMKDNGY